MADIAFDISVIGDKELQAALHELAGPKQKTALLAAFKKAEEKVLVPAVAQRLSGFPVKPRTGRLLFAIVAMMKNATRRRWKHAAQLTVEMPPRSMVGIGPKAPGYYPLHLEYGYDTRVSRRRIKEQMELRHKARRALAVGRRTLHVPAKSYIRAGVNAAQPAMLIMIRAEIRKAIERSWRALARRMKAKRTQIAVMAGARARGSLGKVI